MTLHVKKGQLTGSAYELRTLTQYASQISCKIYRDQNHSVLFLLDKASFQMTGRLPDSQIHRTRPFGFSQMNESEICGTVFSEYAVTFPGISRPLQVLSHCLFASLVYITSPDLLKINSLLIQLRDDISS